MKAVNLIPNEERRGGSAGGRSGNAAYGVLGALAVLVLMAAAFTLTGKTVNQRRATLSDVEQQATAAEAQATKLASYSAFSDLRKKRAETVASIARSRFDWAHVMHEIARVIPSDTHLTSLSGTVSPTAQAPGGSGQALQLRGSNPGPAVDIVGCANGQANVSRMMSRLRLIDGVQHVTLAESTKSDTATAGGGAASGGDSGECRYSDAIARFDVLILFAAPPALAAPAATATPAVPGAATPAAAPASTTTTGSTK
jgi:Tfp pilus assembly protein PilN